jgi:site-specific DNA-methyltransferase (adenine-specific)
MSIHHGDSLEWLRNLPAASVNLIATDPPYYRVKKEVWDRQWKTPRDYLAWLDTVLAEFQRVLAPNGSLYLFASPQMAARVECLIAERFEVLTRITWRKPPYSTKAEMFVKEDLRSFFPASEAIIFAEQVGADGATMGTAGYDRKCDELRGFVFEPLRAYLDGERRRAEVSKADCNAACGFSRTAGGMASRHYFSQSQWCLPTAEHYAALQAAFGAGYLERPYEALRVQYEALRRPFSVSADVPYTDVWDFKTVSHYKGKHVCEKPLDLCRHIVKASSRVGDVVLDAFCGSGSMGHAALLEGRKFIGCEIDRVWVDRANARLAQLLDRVSG